MKASTTAEQRSRSRQLLAVAAGIAILVLAAIAFGGVLSQRGSETPGAAPPTSSLAARGPTQTPAPDVTWAPVAGVDLPISRQHGPRSIDDDLASGFSDSELGAALAAAHVLIRSGPTVGPNIYGPTITEQVVGANAAALKLLVDEQYEQLRGSAGAADGESVAGDAEVVGYRVAAYDPPAGTAQIEVYLSSSDLQARSQMLRFDVQLQRGDDDWQVVAPPRGDWAAATTVLSAEPDGLLRYDEGA